MSSWHSRSSGGGSGAVRARVLWLIVTCLPPIGDGSRRVSSAVESLGRLRSFDPGTLSWVSVLKGKQKLDNNCFNLLPSNG